VLPVLQTRKRRSNCSFGPTLAEGSVSSGVTATGEKVVAGFEVPDEFVVGYGLDYAGAYRNLPDICILNQEVFDGTSS